MKEMRRSIKLVKPGYWVIVLLFVSLIISLFTRGWDSIDDQIQKQEAIVERLTAKVEYASGDIARRTAEYNALYKLNGWAMKVLEKLKRSKELDSKITSVDLEKQFQFTWSIY